MTGLAALDRSTSAVVLVTHDTRDEVIRALDTLPPTPGREVVVVDTGSTDDTVVAVRARRPDVRILELDNAGFGRGANAGVRVTSAEAVVIANADVAFAPGAIEALCRAVLDHSDVAAVGPFVSYPDGTPQASARTALRASDAVLHALLGRFAPRNRWTRRYHAQHLDHRRERDAAWLSGCAFCVRRRAFDAVGGFDPGYFLYVEDVDLGERLRGAGWRLRYDPAARVTHTVGASTSRRRGRALMTHARSIDRYLAGRVGRWSAVSRVALRPALVGWVVVTWVAERVSHGRSPTGERREDVDGKGRE